MLTRKRLLVGMAIASSVLAALWLYVYWQDTRTLALDPPRPHYHTQANANTGVIVLVHGILGSGRSTWRNPTTGTYWPDLLAKDPSFHGFNIFIHEYYTPRAADASSIDALADNMRDEFLDSRIFDHEEVILLVHSMGGLIARAFAFRYQKAYAAQIKLMFFYATPTLGSDIANVFALLTRNPQAAKMKSIKSADYLADQLRNWINAGPQIPSYCAYEELPLLPLGVIVNIGSAAALCGSRLSPITANHEDIAKPRDADDPIHKVFRTAFREVHETVETFRIPANMDLGQVIRALASTENRTVEFAESCNRRLLRQKVLEGIVTGKNSAHIIEQLPAQLTPQLPVSLRAIVNDRGAYEIHCTP
jgi:pimeloyl-ACP methyl ester carboxylesterase